jgi:hypothetical protein
MSDEEKQNEIDLIAFEAALASLVPRSDRLDRDRLMFLAGQQSRTGFQPVITRNRSKPTWAWPAAFSAMTAVATVLATLLVIRPTVPAMGPNPTAIAASANGDTSSLPVRPISKERDPADNIPSASPLFAFLHSFWNNPNQGKAAEASTPIPDSMPYPQLRDRVLRQGIDSWRIAQTFPIAMPYTTPEPSNSRELLKEYLSEMK